jgi:uncharacterized membrane protein
MSSRLHIVCVPRLDALCSLSVTLGKSILLRLWCPQRWRSTLRLAAALLSTAATQLPSLAQAPRALPGAATPQSQTQTQAKKPPTSPPPSPQSTHFPILLLAFGPAAGSRPSSVSAVPVNAPATGAPATTEPGWSIRIGQKGPERFDRPNYPPVMLDPVDVAREGSSDTWTYRAKDFATAADVSVRLTREPCTADASGTKYTFRAEAQHAQIGSFTGCARIAAELFPKISNQTEDEDADQKRPPQPLPADVIKFRAPVVYAYFNTAGKVVFKRGALAKIAAPAGGQLDISHDGQRLLYTREEAGGDHTMVLYDFAGKSTELVRGSVQAPFWSPDDTRLAFLKLVDSHWNLFVASINSPDSATPVYTGDLFAAYGWSDAHTILAGNQSGLLWIGDDGRVQQTVTSDDLYGVGQFVINSANTVRINPINPDLLVVSAELLKPPPGTPTDPRSGTGRGFFLFEIRSKRRSLLSPLNMFATHPEWSRDGVQVFFTSRGPAQALSIFRILWDGSQPKRYLPGYDLTVGQ